MSAYGDYKAGLIDDSEYTRLCNEEYLRSIDEDEEAEDYEDADE